MRKIVIHTTPSERSGVVVEDGRVSEVIYDRPGDNVRPGSIYVGKVVTVHKGLQAAFVDIGEEKHAFLKKEAVPWVSENIEATLREGEELYVQVVKEPLGDKGAQVSADVTVPGLYSVYQPYGGHIAISRKLSTEEADSLRLSVGETLDDTEGAIIRTAASRISRDTLIEELESLKRWWKKKSEKPNKGPLLIHEDERLPDQLIRKYPVHSIEEIVIEDVQVAKAMRERYPSVASLIQWEKSPTIGERSVNEWQDDLTSRNVAIEDGIELVFDQTEAMTVIDVNSHQYQGKAMTNSYAFDVNKRAANEIQRQIRLRNLSGIIIVDFLSMREPSLEKKLLAHMKKQVAKDPVKTSVLGVTKLGLMEMTRKRQSLSLPHLFTERKQVYTTETMVYRLERELLARSRSSAEAVLLTVHPSMNEKKRLLSSSISSRIPQELFVRQDPSIIGYQIELEGSVSMVRDVIESRQYHVDNLF
ncbi:ribonuclease E/G [Halobacillus locisalis]|uniref:Ribonuclease E/G n=1 Tax=Halobacillus locisalis TaxID=220753 RepID=A0A838CNN3_9BACI|nr:ribonuclease E/G [Halobacillus locisalis]MBA2173458.1 ribonuclease E/G [Halobacillus locisalis]